MATTPRYMDKFGLEYYHNLIRKGLIEYIVGTQNEATSAWTGVSKSPSLFAGKVIIYHLPFAGTGEAATLTLTLPTGASTGAKAVQNETAGAVTTEYAADSDIFMVYTGSVWKCSAVDTTYAPLESPAFTGTPTAPTAAEGTRTTQIATTEFATAAVEAEATIRQSADSGLAAELAAEKARVDSLVLGTTTNASGWNVETLTQNVTVSGGSASYNFTIPADATVLEVAVRSAASSSQPWITDNVNVYTNGTEAYVQADGLTVAEVVLKITYGKQGAIDLPELTDIRLGADGTTYPTAGEAVRGQVSALKEDLYPLAVMLDGLTFTHTHTISPNGSYTWATEVIPEGAEVTFVNNCAVAITLNARKSDKTEQNITTNISANGGSIKFVAPFDIYYFRSFVGNTTNYSVAVTYGNYQFDKLKTTVLEDTNRIGEVEEKFTTVIGKNLYDKDSEENVFGISKQDCYSLSGTGGIWHHTVGMDAIYSVSCYIPVEAGKTVYFSANGTTTSVYELACYDASKNFVGSLASWVNHYLIPNNVAYIRVASSQLPNTFQCEYDSRTSYEAYTETIYLNGVKVRSSDVVASGDYFVLPKKFYGVQNKEYDIFLKNVIMGNYNRFIVGKSGTGEQLSRRIRYIIAAAGTTNTNLILYDEKYNQIQSANVSYVNASAEAHSGETLKVLAIGDSFINSGYVTNGLLRDFENDVATLKLLGTLGTAPNLHEGRSGWSSYEYTHEASVGSVSNPFLNNGVFDFANYISANSIEKPDYVIINLGINDGWKDMHGTTTAENLQTMIDSIHTYDASIIVILGTTPSPYLGDGENGYLSHLRTNRTRQNLSRNVLENLTESATVIICPTHLNFDTDYNFNMTTITKNGENDGTVPYCSDDTHPSHMGFYQIADSYYACIKAN